MASLQSKRLPLGGRGGLNNPFYYTPSPRCEQAVSSLLDVIHSHPEWQDEVRNGKTFGVLITESETLFAYSGQMLGRYDIEGFVPPVFDYLDEKGYFKIHEAEIVNINKKIDRLSVSDELHQAREALYEAEKAKPVLPPSRNIDPSSDEYEAYCRQRQFEKGEYRRQKAAWNERVGKCREALQAIQDQITSLKQERKRQSDSLQHWLFEHFVMLNAKGEKKNLLDIFSEWAERTGSKCVIPPSGSGECCAPKLLQYAYIKGLKPREIAEVTIQQPPSPPRGSSLDTNDTSCLEPKEVYNKLPLGGLGGLSFRPACQSRCKPILDWMLQGLEVEANPLEEPEQRSTLPIIFEDERIIVVDKPEGMLSVPGKSKRRSAIDILREKRPDCPELIMAHRLDMQTSGVLVAAKTMEAYKEVQKTLSPLPLKGGEPVCGKKSPFKGDLEGRKTYFALLESVLSLPVGTKGEISLPLSSDYLNRPCQKVDYENGKDALTIYEVMGIVEVEGHPRTLLRLHPVTGRTHQLRVHCAHPDGLGMPILGDDLYGRHAKRLYLHAQEIRIFGEVIRAHVPEWTTIVTQ